MAHGTPDWGVTAGQVTTYQLTDLGELAARLGSPVTHDRRGDVIWWDDFECGLAKWGITPIGTGAAGALSTVRARNGRSSCLLTAGSDNLHATVMNHSAAYRAVGRVGFEASVSLGGPVDSVGWEFEAFESVSSVDFRVKWVDATNTLHYLNAAAAYVQFAANVNLQAEATLFHTGKIVIDAAQGEYVRFVLDDTEYDLSGIAGDSTIALAGATLQARVRNEGRAGNNDLLYVDDVILTQNEPA